MSKAKDRARAQSGLIFRDGEYVDAEEWYAAHLNHLTREAKQADVDKAVDEIMEAKKQAEERGERKIVVVTDKDTNIASILKKAVEREHGGVTAVTENGTVPVPNRYYCTACRKHHTQESKVGKEHTNFYLEA